MTRPLNKEFTDMAKTAKKIETPTPKTSGKGDKSTEFAPEFESPDGEGHQTGLANEGMIKQASAGIQRQPRAREIPAPKFFFLEPEKPKRKDVSKGNEHNQISGGVHQDDPNRSVSYNPVMPNLAMLKETGNPFPKDETHPTVITSPAWQPFVKFAHTLYSVVQAKTEAFVAADLLDEVCKKSKIGVDADGKPTATARKVLMDTLRDMRLYGLVVSENHKHNFKSTKWALVEEPGKIEFIAPPSKS